MQNIVSALYDQIIRVIGNPSTDELQLVAYVTTCIVLLLTVSFIFKIILAIFKR